MATVPLLKAVATVSLLKAVATVPLLKAVATVPLSTKSHTLLGIQSLVFHTNTTFVADWSLKTKYHRNEPFIHGILNNI